MIDLIFASDFIPSKESATHTQHTFKKSFTLKGLNHHSLDDFLLIFEIIYFYIESHKWKVYGGNEYKIVRFLIYQNLVRWLVG